MSTRRQFLVQIAATGVAVNSVAAATKRRVTPSNIGGIKGLARRDATILRLGGSGDNWHMSWGSDDRQLVSLCDGFGWPGLPGYDAKGQEFNSRMYAIRGAPPDVTFEFLPGYPELLNLIKDYPATTDINRYYNFGTIAVGERLYQFLSTPNHKFEKDITPWVGAKLIYSPDNGRTWMNQDGSTPVVWEPWEQRSRRNMVFFEEPQGSFSLLSVLQMGRGYGANRDGYVYVYALNGNTEGTMNELVMFRVPKDKLPKRMAYEYFAGRDSNSRPKWTKQIEARAAVHTFPSGWVNSGGAHPWAWLPSLTYNSPLGVYMMASWAMGLTPDGGWFGKPSYLGFWTAPNPWGPWTQIHEETQWMPGNDPQARAFAPQIAPKWIADDGKSFWLVWSDYRKGERWDTSARFAAESKKRFLPRYEFNVQRVDLVLA